jgi:TRAP-type C4-dicarboxylate transport system substrate-binding protein
MPANDDHDNGEEKMKQRHRIGLVAATLALICAASAAMAQETRLVFATTMPVGNSAALELLAPWVQRVNELGKGSIVVEQRDGPNIATMGNSFDRVTSDAVQIAWGLQPLLGNKFPLTEVAGLPFMSESCEVSGVALWRLYKTGLLDSEYKDIVPLWLMASAQNKIHFAKPPRAAGDLKGLKVNVFNRILVQVVEQFGGTPVSVGPEQQYEALQRGNVDAVLTAWSSFDAYKLQEVTTYHTEAPLGSSTHMFFMSRKKFDGLTAAGRKALEDASGEVQGRIHGKYWDEQEDVQRSKTVATSKHQVVKASAELDDWRKKTQPIIDDWAKSRAGGDKVLATYRKIVAQVQAGK